VDQAINVYGKPDYDWWAENLACELAPGTFGENLTISDLYSSQACIGDRFLIGSTELEITAPRIPCGTLARRMNDRSFTKRFRAAERPGLYCRVLRAGYVQEGDPVGYERYSGDTITALELFRAFYMDHLDESTLRRHLAAPIAIRDRIEKERALAKLTRNVTS
jgi:MOSC domain-containing protein YiiM